MKLKKIASLSLSALFLLPSLTVFSACSGSERIVLRVYNWEEYIDEGGEGSYVYDTLLDEGMSKSEIYAPDILKDFEEWYEKEYGVALHVEYSCFGTNEDLYNQIKLGDKYDLVCPSDYMIMKLAAEGMLEPLSDDFTDQSKSGNYYAQNVSDYIAGVFDKGTLTIEGKAHSWSEYAAGYMWGTTGLIYNPVCVNEDDLGYWDILLNSDYKNKVTAKDNVRDTYFVGLAILYQDELLALDPSAEDYNEKVTEIMNRTDEATIAGVQDVLFDLKKNIFSFETDTGKSDLVSGKIYINFAWSGDAVYALDLAEEDGVYLDFFIPEECANLWFDGWVMPKGANTQAAEAFINFMSMPQNAIRNMYYIGYTSVIAGDDILAYAQDLYGVKEGDEDEAVPYDVSYFFGENSIIYTYDDQLSRQLYAQYPREQDIRRCAVMDYYGDAEAAINELWTKVKGEMLNAGAIIVICVAVVAIALFIVLVKFGGKIDFFRRKPKKGYTLIKQEPYRETEK